MAEGLPKTLRHFFPQFDRWLDEIPDTRFLPFVVYDRRFLLWWGLLLFVFKLRSRRQLDYDLRDPQSQVLSNVNRLASTHQQTLPVHNTLDHFVGHMGWEPLTRLRRWMVQRLIRMKVLDDLRLQGRLVVAVDGTGWLVFDRPHCPGCLVYQQGDAKSYRHMVLEAKLVGQSGLALSVGTEFIENDPDRPTGVFKNDDQTKQDCELKALDRLATSLKKDFPQLKLLLSSDSLYGCGRAIQIAKDRGWSYVFTFKPGRTPALWEEFQSLLGECPQNTLELHDQDASRQRYRWVNGLPYQDSEGRSHVLNALVCEETRQGACTTFAWMTDLTITRQNVAAIATQGGRIRSKIENQGFNVQKNSDLNLEHAYSMNLEKLKAYYLLLQIGHILLQLLELGSVLRDVARRAGKTPRTLWGSLRNLSRRLLEGFRYLTLSDNAYDVAESQKMQIRLSSP